MGEKYISRVKSAVGETGGVRLSDGYNGYEDRLTSSVENRRRYDRLGTLN